MAIDLRGFQFGGPLRLLRRNLNLEAVDAHVTLMITRRPFAFGGI
jgi:hypothetical protein